jgi:hypothetical protein
MGAHKDTQLLHWLLNAPNFETEHFAYGHGFQGLDRGPGFAGFRLVLFRASH